MQSLIFTGSLRLPDPRIHLSSWFIDISLPPGENKYGIWKDSSGNLRPLLNDGSLRSRVGADFEFENHGWAVCCNILQKRVCFENTTKVGSPLGAAAPGTFFVFCCTPHFLFCLLLSPSIFSKPAHSRLFKEPSFDKERRLPHLCKKHLRPS